MKYNISFTDAEIRVVAKYSHDVALRLIDNLLETNASLTNIPQMSQVPNEGFGSFRGSAASHPVLNKILCEFVSSHITDRNSVKIPAIKFVRSITGWGLVDAKKFVEGATNSLGMKLFP